VISFEFQFVLKFSSVSSSWSRRRRRGNKGWWDQWFFKWRGLCAFVFRFLLLRKLYYWMVIVNWNNVHDIVECRIHLFPAKGGNSG
jgi:hypothetical protein